MNCCNTRLTPALSLMRYCSLIIKFHISVSESSALQLNKYMYQSPDLESNDSFLSEGYTGNNFVDSIYVHEPPWNHIAGQRIDKSVEGHYLLQHHFGSYTQQNMDIIA